MTLVAYQTWDYLGGCTQRDARGTHCAPNAESRKASSPRPKGTNRWPLRGSRPTCCNRPPASRSQPSRRRSQKVVLEVAVHPHDPPVVKRRVLGRGIRRHEPLTLLRPAPSPRRPPRAVAVSGDASTQCGVSTTCVAKGRWPPPAQQFPRRPHRPATTTLRRPSPSSPSRRRSPTATSGTRGDAPTRYD